MGARTRPAGDQSQPPQKPWGQHGSPFGQSLICVQSTSPAHAAGESTHDAAPLPVSQQVLPLQSIEPLHAPAAAPAAPALPPLDPPALPADPPDDVPPDDVPPDDVPPDDVPPDDVPPNDVP